MEQLNNGLPVIQEDNRFAGVDAFGEEQKPDLLRQVRQKFHIFGLISLVFGALFTLFFYRAGIGINVLVFAIVTTCLMVMIMKKLCIPVKTGTKLYYTGVILLGLSTTLTSSGILQFLNIIGILFLLDLSLLHQFYEDNRWDFAKHFARMFGVLFHSIASIGMPFVDCFRYFKTTKHLKNEKALSIFIGIVISFPILLIIMALLSGADLLFQEMTKDIFRILLSTDIFAIIFMLIFGFLACYCVICGALAKVGKAEKNLNLKADATIAITVMLILCIVYALFCTIQIVFLFAGGLNVIPEGFTFAEYARRGFFELLAVTIINILLMLICGAFFKESKLLRGLLTSMTICTYIMIASAAYRMLLYIGAYHLTFLRVFVLLALLIDAFVLGGVIASEYNKKFPLFRYCVTVIAVCYIAFSFSRPDYYIASYLASQKQLLELEDIVYLTEELSADAAPVVIPLLNDTSRWIEDETTKKNVDDYGRNEYYYTDKTIQGCIDDYFAKINKISKVDDIREFNLSNYIAGHYTE